MKEGEREGGAGMMREREGGRREREKGRKGEMSKGGREERGRKEGLDRRELVKKELSW